MVGGIPLDQFDVRNVSGNRAAALRADRGHRRGRGGIVAVMDGGQAARPTMEDVARLAGVSHQTVSRMLNDHPKCQGANPCQCSPRLPRGAGEGRRHRPERLDAAGTPPLLRLDAF